MGIKAKIILEDLSLDEISRLFAKLRTLDQDKRYRIFVLDSNKLRSPQLNRYYWGVVLDVLESHTGIDKEDLHEFCKHKFNLKVIVVGNETLETGSSTKILNNVEFIKYYEKIRVWANVELNCNIPEPNQLPDELILELINQGL